MLVAKLLQLIDFIIKTVLFMDNVFSSEPIVGDTAEKLAFGEWSL